MEEVVKTASSLFVIDSMAPRKDRAQRGLGQPVSGVDLCHFVGRGAQCSVGDHVVGDGNLGTWENWCWETLARLLTHLDGLKPFIPHMEEAHALAPASPGGQGLQEVESGLTEPLLAMPLEQVLATPTQEAYR